MLKSGIFTDARKKTELYLIITILNLFMYTYSYFMLAAKMPSKSPELQIRRANRDSSDIFSYFSTKTYVVTPH